MKRSQPGFPTYCSNVPGVTNVFVFKSLGQPNIVVDPDRAAAARYGLNSGDVSAIVQAAIGGQPATQVLEGDRSFPLVVRWKPEYRQSIDAMRNIRVNVPTGGNVPLGQIARVEASEGASFIYRGDLQRYVPVRFSVTGRDLQSAVAEAKTRVAQEVRAARGHASGMGRRVWRVATANRRLAVVIPVALLLIMGVLYGATLRSSIPYDHGAGPGRLPGRSAGAVRNRDAVQRFRRGRLHLDLRRSR